MWCKPTLRANYADFNLDHRINATSKGMRRGICKSVIRGGQLIVKLSNPRTPLGC